MLEKLQPECIFMFLKVALISWMCLGSSGKKYQIQIGKCRFSRYIFAVSDNFYEMIYLCIVHHRTV